MSSSIVIREAQRGDCPEICRLINELAKARNQLDKLKIDVETLQKDGFDSDQPHFHGLVAHLQDDTDALIGICTYSFIYSWGGRGVQVCDLYVTPEYQGHGIGTRLLQEVTKRASENGCLRVNFRLLPEDEATRNHCESKSVLNVSETYWYLLFSMDEGAMHRFANNLNKEANIIITE